MKVLVVNADDMGVSDDIDSGIIECFKNGIVRDTSILATGEYFAHAVGLLKENKITAAGVHISLTGGFKSVLPHEKVRTITDKNGVFAGHFPEFISAYASGRISRAEVAAECAAQIAKVKKENFYISHLDSHEHIHMFPPVLDIVMQAAKDEKVPYIRIPNEKVPFAKLAAEPVNWFRHAALSVFCCMAKKAFQKNGSLMYNNHFLGHFHAHKLTEGDFLSFINDLPDGVTEIGCHPGFFGANISRTRPWYKSCEEEVKALCSDSVKLAIKEKGIRLCSYGEMV